MTASGPPYATSDWKAAAAAKREQLYNSIPKDHLLPSHLATLAASSNLLPEDPRVLSCGILTARDIEITSEIDPFVLLARIASKEYSAVQVTTAFCKRASIAQQCITCLTEYFPMAALSRARELDEYYSQTGKTMGPLHGLPMSLKDCYGIKGYAVSAGLVSWIPNIVQSNSTIADGIVAAGGVLYCKTATSQGHLMVESITNLFGTVKNPHNLDLSAGGSSGGEAALLASKGSIVATGTDGGGSIRFPAMFCGVWGLKCSKGRMPGMGIGSPRDGSESVNGGLGPMAKTVGAMELWMEVQSMNEPWEVDSGCIPMPWNKKLAERPSEKITFAVIWDDGVVRPSPPVTRALKIMVSKLKAAGHTVVDLPPEKIKSIHRRSQSCVMRSNVQSGGFAVMPSIHASGEPVVPRTATGHAGSALTREEVFANHLVRGGLTGEYTALWNEFQMDAILAPAVAHPACPHGRYISNSYAAVYNMLDYVTGSFPVTVVDEVADIATREWYEGEVYDRIEEKLFPYDLGDKEMKELYTGPEVFSKAPVGLQIACKRLREEKCIGIMKELELLLK